MGITLQDGSAIAQILDLIIKYVLPVLLSGLLGGFIGELRARRKFHDKRERRLFANVKRPVALLPTKVNTLELEERLLKKVDFFKVDLLPADARSIDEITNKYRLAIIRYEDSKAFWHTFHKLADNKMPLIIYANPGEIPVPKMQDIQNYYTRYTLCNTPVRLLSDVFAIMSVYPEMEGVDD